MGTDVSSFKDKYQRKPGEADVASTIVMPQGVEVTFRGIKAHPESKSFDMTTRYVPVSFPVRYGTNPHQTAALYKPEGRLTHVGDMHVHQLAKDGFSLTNLEDISRAVDVLKYARNNAVVIMKHLGPCGFAEVSGLPTQELYDLSLATDPRSAFGGTIGFNRIIDAETAEKIMELFTENVVAPGYTPEALKVLARNVNTDKKNSLIRVVEICDMQRIPKYWGDDVTNHLTMRTLPTGEFAVEVPYLSGVRSIEDFIVDPQVNGTEAQLRPTRRMLEDALIGWNLARATRSNAVAFVKDGQAVGIGMGQQDRAGAVELGIQKAIRYGLDLEGSVMVSEAFFPFRDSIDTAAENGVVAFAWPAGSKKDREIIEAGNDNEMAMMVPVTGERSFNH